MDSLRSLPWPLPEEMSLGYLDLTFLFDWTFDVECSFFVFFWIGLLTSLFFRG